MRFFSSSFFPSFSFFFCFFLSLPVSTHTILQNIKIATVPVGLYTVPAITTINLRGNRLKTLPTGIEVSSKLKVLTLADNPWDIASAKIVEDGLAAILSYMQQKGPKSSQTHAQIAHQAQAFQNAHKQSSSVAHPILVRQPTSEIEADFMVWLQVQGFEKVGPQLTKHNLSGFEPLLRTNAHELVELGIVDKINSVKLLRAVEEYRRRFVSFSLFISRLCVSGF